MASSAAAYEGGGGGGGGIGGKFRKRPFRRSTAAVTPYDRPSSAVRGAAALRGARDGEGGGGWISRLVDPASRIISTGASRLFSSVFRKRFHPALPPPPPLPTPPSEKATAPLRDPNLQSSEQVLGNLNSVNQVTDNKLSIEMNEKSGLDIQKQINKSEVEELSDLEQLLQKKTFTRVEFDRLTELLRSRTIESDGSEPVANNKDIVHVTLAQNELGSSKLLGGISMAGRSSSLPAAEIASPAEIAKAYMGSRPSKLSPSSLSLQSQGYKNEMATRTNLQSATKVSDVSVVAKSIVRFSGTVERSENGYLTPKARGRSAICRMSRSPFFKVQSTRAINSGTPAWDHHAGMSASSQGTPKSLNTDGKQVLKRPSSVLDNDIGSLGPIRRIRQKSNFVSPSVGRRSSFHGDHSPSASRFMSKDLNLATESSYKRALPFEKVGHGGRHNQDSGDGGDLSCAVTPIPPQSSEMARKILEQLDRLVPSPKEKSSEPKAIPNHDSSSKGNPNKKDEVKDERAKGAVLGVVETSIKDKAVTSIMPSTPIPKKVDSLMSNSVVPPSRKPSFQMTLEDSTEMDEDESHSRDGASQPKEPNNAVVDDFRFNAFQTPPASENALKASDGPVHAEKPDVLAFPVAPVPSLSQPTSAPTMPAPSSDSSAQQTDQASAPFGLGSKDGTAFNFSSGVAGVSDSDGHKTGTSDSQISVLPESFKSIHKEKLENVTGVDNAALSSVSTSSALPIFSFGSPAIRTLSNGSNGLTSPTNSSVLDAVPSSNIGVASSSMFTSSSSAVATASQFDSASVIPSQPPLSSNYTKNDTKILEEKSIKASPFSFDSSSGTRTSMFSSSASSIFSVSTATSAVSTTAAAASSFIFASSGSGSSSLPAASSSVSFIAGNKSSAPPELFSFSSTGSTSSGLAKPYIFGNNGEESSAPALLFSSSSRGSTIAPSSSSSASASPSPALFSTAGNSFNSSSTQPFGTQASAVLTSIAGSMSGTTDTRSGMGLGQVGSTAITFGFSSSSSSSSSGFGNSNFGSATSAGSSSHVFGFSAGAGSSSSSGRSSFAPATTASLFSATSQPSTTSSWFSTSQPPFSTSQPSTSPFFGSTTASVSTVSSSFGSTYGATTTASTPFSFGSSAPAASSPLMFSFTSSASTSSLSPSAAPVFGMSTPTTGFGSVSPGNDQMNMEDSMIDDNNNLQATVPPFPTFGQSSSSLAQSSVFQFGGNQASTPQNAPSFQGAGNVEFTPGGSFSLGSGGDKSSRRIVKVRRDRHRKK